MIIEYEKFGIEPLQKFVGPAAPIYILSSSSQDMTAKQKAFAESLRAAFEQIPALTLRR